MGVRSRVFFDRQKGFYGMRFVFARHLFDNFCRLIIFGAGALLKSKTRKPAKAGLPFKA